MDYLAEYAKIVGPMTPIFNDAVEADKPRAVLHHQVGLINCAITLQQLLVAWKTIEATETITLERMTSVYAQVSHLHSDRMCFVADMNDEVLEAIVIAMYPIVSNVIETMGIPFGDVHGE